jgi:hypothetical protein
MFISELIIYPSECKDIIKIIKNEPSKLSALISSKFNLKISEKSSHPLLSGRKPFLDGHTSYESSDISKLEFKSQVEDEIVRNEFVLKQLLLAFHLGYDLGLTAYQISLFISIFIFILDEISGQKHAVSLTSIKKLKPKITKFDGHSIHTYIYSHLEKYPLLNTLTSNQLKEVVSFYING